MSTLAQIADKKACGGTNSVNTGKLGCLVLFGEPTHMLSFTKGTVVPKSTVFNDAYIRPLVQKGTITPLIDASAFEDISSEDQVSTNSKGVERVNMKGLPKYRLKFEEGHEFYRQLSKMTSFKSREFWIGDDEGNWMCAKNSNGDFVGFTAGQVVAEIRKTKVTGGDAESKSLTVQFLDRLQWDEKYVIIHQDNLEWTPQELPMINGVNLEFATIPSNLDTTINVIARLASDNDTYVTGLAKEDFIATVGGSNNPITNLAETSDGNYTLTLSALATNDVLFVDLFDSSLNLNVINSNNVLYRSDNGATVTVVV